MKLQDIKVGMILEIEKTNEQKCEETHLAMVVNTKNGLAISGDAIWFPLNCFDDDLIYLGDKVIKIYDLCNSNMNAYKLSTEHRELIWTRKDEIDWAKVEVDTPIEITNHSLGANNLIRHFAKYEDGIVYTWHGGKTSFTSEGKTSEMVLWDAKYCSLYNK